LYSPPQFQQHDRSELTNLIQAHPLSTIVTLSPLDIEANHIPLLWRDDGSPGGVLCGHIARANPLWQQHDPSSEVLAVFHGPNAYISPSWYASKPEHGRGVPTWNYTAVHAYGQLRVVEEAEWLRSHLEDMTQQLEVNIPEPWALSDAPPEFVERLLAHIVGIEILVSRLSGKWKISQNQPQSNQQSVIAGLRNRGQSQAEAVAELMQRCLNPLND
jgi:transcriptional regulator